jgi:outer membrane protein OmpA-like peptidoglycan-associated protein
MSRERLLVVALLFGALLTSSSASAQVGFSAQRYRMPPSADDGFGLFAPWTPPHLALDVRLGLDFAHAPLVLSDATADARERRAAVVDASFAMSLAVGLGIVDQLAAWVTLPVVLYQGGDDAMATGVAVPSAQAIGDFEIGVRGWFFGERAPSEGFSPNLGLTGALVLPTGAADALAGDGSVGFRTTLTAALGHATVTPLVNLGFAYRPDGAYQTYAYAGSELTYGLGVHVWLDPVRIEGELRGATTVTGDGAFEDDGTALELLVGLTASVADVLRLGAAVDLGLSQAPGVPDVRVLGTVALLVPLASEGGGDGDGDGDGDGGGGGVAGEDRDNDGVDDGRDRCPDEPEDPDRIQDDDGCPETDADDDGIIDGNDFCPNDAETENDYRDEDGCADGATIEGTMLTLSEPILFPERSARIEDEVAAALGLIAATLRDRDEIRLVQIEGHASADETGNDRRALTLSESRAQAVLEWLTGHGIATDRLTFVGLGADQPADRENQAQNRRVTFRILEQ